MSASRKHVANFSVTALLGTTFAASLLWQAAPPLDRRAIPVALCEW
jgi:hypothetical protein